MTDDVDRRARVLGGDLHECLTQASGGLVQRALAVIRRVRRRLDPGERAVPALVAAVVASGTRPPLYENRITRSLEMPIVARSTPSIPAPDSLVDPNPATSTTM